MADHGISNKSVYEASIVESISGKLIDHSL